MKPKLISGKTASVLAATLIIVVAMVPGCRSAPVPERTEEIDAVFRAGTSRLAEATACINAIREFDFENAMFLEDVRDALDTSGGAMMELRESIDGMEGLDYSGALADLGIYVEKYSSAMSGALDELEGVCAGIAGIMDSIEPVLRAEAVITQMEAPLSDEEFKERLARLDGALAPSLAALAELEVPVVLHAYRALLEEIMTTLHKLVVDLTAAVNGLTPEITPTSNPDFLHLRELLAGYPSVVEELGGSLKINSVDELVERVELEINRLYMGGEE